MGVGENPQCQNSLFSWADQISLNEECVNIWLPMFWETNWEKVVIS